MQEEKQVTDYRYRLHFEKTGTFAYVSHLDLVRTFTRLFMRAELPLYFSEGFNPHPKMVFSVPLPLGMESTTELLDFRTVEKLDPVSVTARLCAVSPIGLVIRSLAPAEGKLSEIAFAEYTVTYAVPPGKAGEEAFSAFLAQERILAEKKGKDGAKTVDIRPMIERWERLSDTTFRALLSVSSDRFLGPDLFRSRLHSFFEEHVGGPAPSCRMVRTAFYRSDAVTLFS